MSGALIRKPVIALPAAYAPKSVWEERCPDIERMVAANLSDREIGIIYGVTSARIGQIRKQLGIGMPIVTLPAPAPRDGRINPGDLVDIHDMLAAGLKLPDIAHRYQVTVETLEAFILQHRNAQITKYPPRRAIGTEYGGVVRPSGGLGASL